MATVTRDKSGAWRVRYRNPDNRQRSRNFKRKADADRFAVEVEHQRLSGIYVDPTAGRKRFKTFAEEWRTIQPHRPSTAAQVETNLRRNVYPYIGQRSMSSIRPSHIQAMMKALESHLAPRTIELVHTWVATIFASAVHDRVISDTPCKGIRLPRPDERKVVVLEVATVLKLINDMSERYRAVVVLAATTGVRISEALGLTNDQIDWLRKTVTIDRQLVGVGKDGSPIFGPVKDKNNRPRTIPLPEGAITELSAHIARFGLGPAGLLFTGPRGGPVRRTTFSDSWQAAAAPLGVEKGEGLHQLRHFYASLLIRAGESVKVVQERLGHRSATMTLDVYGHLWPNDEDRTRRAVDEVLGTAFSSPSGDSAVSD